MTSGRREFSDRKRGAKYITMKKERKHNEICRAEPNRNVNFSTDCQAQRYNFLPVTSWEYFDLIRYNGYQHYQHDSFCTIENVERVLI